MTPKSRAGRYSLNSAIETRNGSRVWDATSSGPAEIATPSPTLLTPVDARSQRKFAPRRAGATVSVMRVGRRRTGGRIPVRGRRFPDVIFDVAADAYDRFMGDWS